MAADLVMPRFGASRWTPWPASAILQTVAHLAKLLLLTLLFATPLATQTRVSLPYDTGDLTAPDSWTILGAEELEEAERPSDPEDEPASTILLGSIESLQQKDRTEDNLLLHQPGSTDGQIRIINAYSADVTASSADLQSEATTQRVRDAMEDALAGPGLEIVFHGRSEPALFPVGCLGLTWRLEDEHATIHKQLIIVPAGNRLQYFEIIFAPDDLDAQIVMHEVIRTFDGAREDDTLRQMLIGGAVAAVVGIATAMFRRRRRPVPAPN